MKKARDIMIDLKYSVYSVGLKEFTDLGISMIFTSQHLNVGQDVFLFQIYLVLLLNRCLRLPATSD